MPSPTAELLQDAVTDLQRYLSDETAPMLAADSIDALIDAPPDLMAVAIRGWIDAQYAGLGRRVSIAEYAFHALKKLMRMADLDLIPRERMAARVAELSGLLLESLAVDQREALAIYLQDLTVEDPGESRPVELIHRPQRLTTGEVAIVHESVAPIAAPDGLRTGAIAIPPIPSAQTSTTAPPPGVRAAPAESTDVVAGLERLGTLLARLEERLAHGPPNAAAPSAPAIAPESVAPILAAAAASARSAGELGDALARVEKLGAEIGSTGEIFRALAKQIPGWMLTGEGADAVLPASTPARAMERLVDLADSPAERASRFHEMILAGIERLEEGALPQAAKTFALAERLVVQHPLPPDVLHALKRRARERISEARLVDIAADPATHPLLRPILRFFPQLTVQGLLSDIYEEPAKARRQLLLSIARIHGDEARGGVLEALGRVLGGDPPDPEGYFRRNLLFLLRRLARSAEPPEAREIELIARASRVDGPLIVVKEGIGALAVIEHPAAEAALVALLRELERNVLVANRTPHGISALHGLLDRVAGALAAQPSPSAARHVANHALRDEAPLGATRARLEALGRRDLAGDPALFDPLLAHLRAELPRKVLGVVVGRKQENAVHFVRALASTRTPALRDLLQEIAKNFAGQPLGTVAHTVLSTWSAPAPAPPADAPAARASVTSSPDPAGTAPPSAGGAARAVRAESLAGDVDLFGLPNLLQSLLSSGVTGVLSLSLPTGAPHGEIAFVSGRLSRCRLGEMRGETALYHLLEMPVPGRFTVSPSAEAGAEADFTPPVDPMPYVLEGLRRHDELGQVRALVPDDAHFARDTATPTMMPDESDGAFARALLRLALEGRSASECERSLATDPFRARRLLAHWLGERALTLA